MERVYDRFIYEPISRLSRPLVYWLPAEISLGGHKMSFFTANNVTYFRTLLVFPILYSILYSQNSYIACALIVFHDYLDHLDGVVAREHVKLGLLHSETAKCYGAYLDAMCDKLVNMTTLIALLWSMNGKIGFITFALSMCTVGYESALAWVRTIDYLHSTSEKSDNKKSPAAIRANLSGKFKEKTESIALALLALDGEYHQSVIAFLLFATIILAHQSLMYKLRSH